MDMTPFHMMTLERRALLLPFNEKLLSLAEKSISDWLKENDPDHRVEHIAFEIDGDEDGEWISGHACGDEDLERDFMTTLGDSIIGTFMEMFVAALRDRPLIVDHDGRVEIEEGHE